MGHIKEPDGVDFVIKSRPLTKEEKEKISSYIKAYKAKHSEKGAHATRTPKSLKPRKKVLA